MILILPQLIAHPILENMPSRSLTSCLHKDATALVGCVSLILCTIVTRLKQMHSMLSALKIILNVEVRDMSMMGFPVSLVSTIAAGNLLLAMQHVLLEGLMIRRV
eukprot:5163852-Ditylum_brightwellii.AAC.1